MNVKVTPFMPRQVPGAALVFPEQDAIRAAAKKLGLTWVSSVEYLDQLSDKNLQLLFNELYRGPQKKFIEYYHLLEITFLKYVSSQIVDLDSRAAIQKWLLETAGLSSLVQVKNEPVNLQAQIRETIDQLDLSIKEVLDQVSFIVLLDGDNSPHVMIDLLGISGIYLVCYQLKDTFSHQMEQWFGSPFFAIRYTLQYAKDAADALMCMDAAFLHLLLPTNLSFIIISGDEISQEVSANLQQLGRSSVKISPRFRKIRLYFELLHEPELWTSSSSDPIMLANQLKSQAQQKRVPSYRNPSTHFFWTGNQPFQKTIQESNVSDIATELVYLGLPIPTTDQNGQDLNLRIQWKMNWTGSFDQFLRKYQLGKTEFSKYLEGGPSPKSEAAVRDFLSHQS